MDKDTKSKQMEDNISTEASLDSDAKDSLRDDLYIAMRDFEKSMYQFSEPKSPCDAVSTEIWNKLQDFENKFFLYYQGIISDGAVSNFRKIFGDIRSNLKKLTENYDKELHRIWERQVSDTISEIFDEMCAALYDSPAQMYINQY